MTPFIPISLLLSLAAADPRLDTLVACAAGLEPSTDAREVRRDRGSIFVADHDDKNGWSLLVFGKTARRCPLPAAIQGCFRTNPNCPSFEFLFARPETRDGVGVTFDGRAIDDVGRTARVGASFRALAKGTIDEKGRIGKVVRAGPSPLLGLACNEDRTPPVLARLERALARDLAKAPSREALAKCANVPALASAVEAERRKLAGPAAPGAKAPEGGAPAAAH